MTTPGGSDDQVLLRVQRRVLELIAEGQPITDVLATLCRALEQAIAGTRCSILLLDRDGVHIRHAAGPSLPQAYTRGIDGQPIGPFTGSCGTAMYTGGRVVVEDIETDVRWAPYRDLALAHDLRACASIPIVGGSDREMLGSFALYHSHKGPFSEREIHLHECLTDLAAVAIVNHRRENALRESEARRTRTEAFSLVMVTEQTLDGRWLKVPPTLCRLLGRSEAELLGTKVVDHTHPDDIAHEQSELARLCKGEIRSFDLEKRFVRADGHAMWTYVNTSVVCDDAEQPVYLLTYIRDISDRKQADEMLRRTQKAESLALLAGGVAHDFNNLLAAMGANASLLARHVERDTEALTLVRNVEQLVQQAASFTQRLLAYAGKARAEVRERDLNELVSGVVHLMGVSVPKGVQLHIELPPNLPPVEADSAQLQQVVMNLITNAAEAIPSGRGAITVRTGQASLSAKDIEQRFPGQPLSPGHFVILEVSDTGVGMSTEVMARIFEPFYSTKVSGRGLGLAATLGILKAHHGGIEITSEEGRGSTFRLFFPAATRTTPKTIPPVSERPVTSPHALDILLVDDEQQLRTAMTQLFELLGHHVRAAQDANEALAVLEAHGHELDVVVMDVSMPGLSGLDAAAIIAERWPGLPVVLSSGYAEPVVPIEAACVTFLQKPYTLNKLERVLNDVAQKYPRKRA